MTGNTGTIKASYAMISIEEVCSIQTMTEEEKFRLLQQVIQDYEAKESNLIQILQTVIINKQIDREEAHEKEMYAQRVDTNLPSDAKTIMPKSVSDVKESDKDSDGSKKTKKSKW